jgi:hypothetical protein
MHCSLPHSQVRILDHPAKPASDADAFRVGVSVASTSLSDARTIPVRVSPLLTASPTGSPHSSRAGSTSSSGGSLVGGVGIASGSGSPSSADSQPENLPVEPMRLLRLGVFLPLVVGLALLWFVLPGVHHHHHLEMTIRVWSAFALGLATMFAQIRYLEASRRPPHTKQA